MTAVPAGTVSDVLDWVGDDPQRAEEALDAEYAGLNRSTLITKLEAIASADEEDDSMTETETESQEAPAPEVAETAVDVADESTTVLGTAARDADVEPYDGIDQLPVGVAVEFIGGAVAPHGFLLQINGDGFVFTPELTASLKSLVDSAIAGLSL